jgi:hypothetical protein
MADRKDQLERLIKSLRQLRDILRGDPTCRWTAGIESFGYEAEQLAAHGFSQSDLNGLSTSVQSIYGGMGSFSDYIPQADGRVLPWVDAFDKLRGDVYENALALKVTGNETGTQLDARKVR